MGYLHNHVKSQVLLKNMAFLSNLWLNKADLSRCCNRLYTHELDTSSSVDSEESEPNQRRPISRSVRVWNLSLGPITFVSANQNKVTSPHKHNPLTHMKDKLNQTDIIAQHCHSMKFLACVLVQLIFYTLKL